MWQQQRAHWRKFRNLNWSTRAILTHILSAQTLNHYLESNTRQSKVYPKTKGPLVKSIYHSQPPNVVFCISETEY